MTQRHSEVEIAIVGAGAAGLAAGAELARANRGRFVVLEAGARVGGRAWTRDAGGQPIDMGCGWLHSSDENPFVAIAGALGVELDQSAPPWEKDAWAGNFPLEDQREYRRAWGAFYERLYQFTPAGPDRPASDFLEPGNPWNGLVDAGSTFINGVELAGVSTIDLRRYHDSDVDWRAPGGYGALIARLGDGLPIELNCPASVVDHSGPRVRIETPRGTISAGAAIITISTNLLAREAIRFTPALPEKIDAASKLPLGVADKLFLSLEGGDDLPIDGRLYGARDRAAIGSYHLRPFGRPLIECYFGGAFARELERGGDAAFADFAIAEIVGALGSGYRARLKPLAATGWARDPLALGSYSHARVGHSDARKTLAAPVDDRIFFAGEACSGRDFSTAHGAYRTGVTAARAAMNAR